MDQKQENKLWCGHVSAQDILVDKSQEKSKANYSD